jgi:hypothetical protein
MMMWRREIIGGSMMITYTLYRTLGIRKRCASMKTMSVKSLLD